VGARHGSKQHASDAVYARGLYDAAARFLSKNVCVMFVSSEKEECREGVFFGRATQSPAKVAMMVMTKLNLTQPNVSLAAKLTQLHTRLFLIIHLHRRRGPRRRVVVEVVVGVVSVEFRIEQGAALWRAYLASLPPRTATQRRHHGHV
jgi:hypothetical protein